MSRTDGPIVPSWIGNDQLWSPTEILPVLVFAIFASISGNSLSCESDRAEGRVARSRERHGEPEGGGSGLSLNLVALLHPTTKQTSRAVAVSALPTLSPRAP